MVTLLLSGLAAFIMLYLGDKWREEKVRSLKLQGELTETKRQKKSSEVRLGLIVEQMGPFLKDFPYDPKKAVFLGKPIDYVVFEDDSINFVEVKSGDAKLSSKQRKIRDLINNKKVKFEVYQVKGD